MANAVLILVDLSAASDTTDQFFLLETCLIWYQEARLPSQFLQLVLSPHLTLLMLEGPKVQSLDFCPLLAMLTDLIQSHGYKYHLYKYIIFPNVCSSLDRSPVFLQLCTFHNQI